MAATERKAEILGALYECEQFYRRTGLFRSLIEDGVVSTEKNTIIDSVQNVKFVTGQVPDARKFGFMAPCPDTARRIAIRMEFSCHTNTIRTGGCSYEVRMKFVQTQIVCCGW